MQRDEEAALVRQVASGDRGAFRLLVETHQRALGAYARRMLWDQDAANDIVQETFLRLWTRAGSYNSTAARLTTWLHNIAHNLCVDSFRKQSRMPLGELEHEPASDDLDPAGHREAEDRERRVRSAVTALPERQRSALILCHYQGLSNRDAAEILNVSVDALESLLARARRRLKQELHVHDQ